MNLYKHLLVRAGLGLTVLPASARELRAEPSLRSRVIDDPAFVRPLSLVKKRSRSLSPAAQHFVSVCVAAFVVIVSVVPSAGSNHVVVPSAPVAGSMVPNPLVALPSVIEPSVPAAPSVGVEVAPHK